MPDRPAATPRPHNESDSRRSNSPVGIDHRNSIGGSGLSLLVLVVMPWQIAKASTPGQSWVVSAQGVRITLPGTDVRHDWPRFEEIVIRPSVVQFRIGRCSLSLPRRYVTEQDLATIKALAACAGVTIRQGGHFR